ncbi:Translation protein, beta-barrel domain [Pseudocohnilembus persalinus]|uniref:Translation protein, beta-barrel domain n=1 Tax=Pseudocohnilembus persalinus TaxID=266149 RepID=A0A0V0QW76_PSEPJ|nr:Translation protein, beta-barrel domain [Pseudocohnilembus persalinus]|eukprot:KRX06478.1 Translation protein, beta-barrel domain [Pseudocohnilembus persalinus]
MSRHTQLKGFLEEADEEFEFEEQQNGGPIDDYDLSPEDETIVEDLQSEFSNQFSKKTIIDVLDSEEWDVDMVRKILKEALEIYEKFAGQIKIDKLVEHFYNTYWNKKDCIKRIDEIVKQKQEQEQKAQERKAKKEQQNEQQKKVRKQSTNLKPTRKESQELSRELLNEKTKKENQHHSIKIERFQQETDISNYNKIYPQIDYKINISEEEQQSNHINLVTVGHVDSGKSTLIGHLRYILKDIDSRQMHKLEKESNQNNKGSFKYAYAQDELEQEKQGITVHVGYNTIKTDNVEINLLDSPGHQDYVPHMIGGTAQADYAMLVIDSGPNSFESGFEKGGQTKEHAYLIKAFGVERVIVAINKMDLHDWDKERFNEVSGKVVSYLLSIGFSSQQIRTIPLSGFKGQNISKPYKEQKWYNGPCLIELLDSLKPPKRDTQKPLRFNVFSATNKRNISGLCMAGKLEGGILKKGDKIIVQPHGIIAQVKEITLNNQKTQYAKSGDNIEIISQLKHDIEERYVDTGNVVCGFQYAIPVTKSLIIEFVAFDLIYPILKGAEVMVYINTAKTDGFLYKITKLIDKNNGNVLKKNPKCIKSNECAEIKLNLRSNICAELYANYKTYGRVILRDSKHTIGVGIIKEIL